MINKLVEIIFDYEEPTQEIDESTELESIPTFDSLAVLTLIAFADEELNKEISGDDVSSCKTFGDLVKLLA